MVDPLTAEKLAEAIAAVEFPRTGVQTVPGPVRLSGDIVARLARAVWPLVREALDAERLAATADALAYAADWWEPETTHPLARGRRLRRDLTSVLTAECCPVCAEIRCDDGCPIAPIRNRQEPSDD
jgi:hypothetical protein